MNSQVYPVLGTPGVGFFTMLLIGAIAGWIAEKITSSNHGIFTNILVGIAGSFVGTRLAELGGLPVNGFIEHLIAAAVGAVILLWIWGALRNRGNVAGPGPGPAGPGRTPIDKI
jgi:uncharacterized membrane protein YeaQ/YmgE (transglycosylase-associated protein family)